MSKQSGTKNACVKWFELQHGERPNDSGLDDEALKNTRKAGRRAEAELRARAEYDARLESALCAWQAKQ